MIVKIVPSRQLKALNQRWLEAKKRRLIFAVILLLIGLTAFLPGCSVWGQFMGEEEPEENPPVSEPEPQEEERQALHPPVVNISPARPVRGDHVVIEVGPFLEEPAVLVESDLRGDMSLPYWHEDWVHILLAVSYFNEPGEYSITFEAFWGDNEVWEGRETLEVVEGDFTFQSFSMPASRTDGWTSKQLEEDREKTRQAREITYSRPLWYGSFEWPLEGRISSDYGAMRSINNRNPTRHNGIDIAAREGTPLAAANKGVVRLAEHLLASGNIIIIDHGLDVSSAYLHLHEIYVEVGQWVDKGEIIGTVGQTGYATGPHLHWSVFVGHTPVSPYAFMDGDYPVILYRRGQDLNPN